jgi:hypothetical protein
MHVVRRSFGRRRSWGDPVPAAVFEWREIVCDDEETARREAERQQANDDAELAEWIYLRNAEGIWVARRVPRD